jgi:hypothetical protein
MASSQAILPGLIFGVVEFFFSRLALTLKAGFSNTEPIQPIN